MKRYFMFILQMLTLVCIYSCEKEIPSISSLPVRTSMVFNQNEDGYVTYRIPTTVITNNGTILAFAEGRHTREGDYGGNDIVLKRSVDQGHSWSKLTVLQDAGENRCHNAVPVYLPEEGKVILLYCQNIGAGNAGEKSSVFQIESQDDGKTWSEPRDLTTSVTQGFMETQLGPCHGIVKRFEPNKGRIVIPGCHTTVESPKTLWSHVIYSDDKGKTWHVGGSISKTWTGESTVAELSNGELMLNMRDQAGKKLRLVSISKDAGETWSEAVPDKALIEPTCQGALLYYGNNGEDGKGILLFSNPESNGRRFNGTLKMSIDNGQTWTSSYSYTGEDRCGYSDLFRYQKDGMIGVLYEFGMHNVGIAFQNIPLDKLKPIK